MPVQNPDDFYSDIFMASFRTLDIITKLHSKAEKDILDDAKPLIKTMFISKLFPSVELSVSYVRMHGLPDIITKKLKTHELMSSIFSFTLFYSLSTESKRIREISFIHI